MNNFYNSIKCFFFLFFLFCQTLSAQPVISSFEPVSGPIGTTVMITGSNFNPSVTSNVVYFGAVRATVSAATSNLLTVVVPTGATYQSISVTASGLTAYSTNSLNVTFPGGGAIIPGSFSTVPDSVMINTTMGPYGMAVSDLDGDGKTDVAFVDGDHTLSILKNTSTKHRISFAPKLTFQAGGGPYNLAIGDLNGDGKPDLALINFAIGGFSVHQNTSSGGSISFTQAVYIRGGRNPTSISISDLNLDGAPDIIAKYSNSVTIYKNTSSNGILSFTIGVEHIGNSYLGEMAVGDIDGDGKVDIAIGDNEVFQTIVLRNISTPDNIAFAPKQILHALIYGDPIIADLNQDGKPDMLVPRSGITSIFKNTSTSGIITFASPTSFTGGVPAQGTAVCDIDGDGWPDLAFPKSSPRQIAILRNIGTAGTIAFADVIHIPTGIRPFYTAAADLDGDGKADLISANLGNATPDPVTFSIHNSIYAHRNIIGEPAVIPSGTNPIIGPVETMITVDASVQNTNGMPYVQRHYDIEPENNPGSATATLTLYFYQSDFDNYNAHPNHGASLPASGTDMAGISALRVIQHHGFSTTSVPGSYSGTSLEINPDDSKIVWDASEQRWEVTFDVTGFSGFFVNSSANSTLPLTLLDFSAGLSGFSSVLRWVTTDEVNLDFFEIQRSDNGADFIPLTQVPAAGSINASKVYEYVNILGGASVYYYRLKIVDIDGSFKLSKVVSVLSKDPGVLLGIYPNPAKDYLQVNHPYGLSNAKLTLLDLGGKIIKRIDIKRNVLQTKLNLNGLRNGSYKVVWSDGKKTLSQTLIIDGNLK